MPVFLPRKSLLEKTLRLRPSWRKPKTRWPGVSKNGIASSRVKDKNLEFQAAIAALKRGEVIVFPTETLYGLGADALNRAAVERVFRLKGREAATPISVLVAERTMQSTIVAHVPPLTEKLIAQFWPGPLTVV